MILKKLFNKNIKKSKHEYYLEKYKKNPNSLYFLPFANSLIKLELFEEAKDVLLQGVKAYPENISAKMSLGRSHYHLGELNDAYNVLHEIYEDLLDSYSYLVLYLDVCIDLNSYSEIKKICKAGRILFPKEKKFNLDLFHEALDDSVQLNDHIYSDKQNNFKNNDIIDWDISSDYDDSGEGKKENRLEAPSQVAERYDTLLRHIKIHFNSQAKTINIV